MEQNQRNEVRDLGSVATSLKSQPGMKNQCYVARCLNAGRDGYNDGTDQTYVVGFSQESDGSTCRNATDLARPITGRHGDPGVVAFQTRIARNSRGQPKEIVDALTSCEGGSRADVKPHVAGLFGVRRLMPVECLRLQGLPDNWLDLDPPLSDSAKYRMIGNSVAVPVIEWIGRRILKALGGEA